MIKVLIYFGIGIVAISMILVDPKEGSMALLLVSLLSYGFLVAFRRHTDEKDFITYAFLGALCARLVFGLLVHTYELRDFLGPDSFGYDLRGSMISDFWLGHGLNNDPELKFIMSLRGPGWGMNYLVACIYTVTGRSIFIAQSFCAVIGAAAVPMVYFCSFSVFHNKRSAKIAALIVAFFPAFIIWSSQLLKDGLIVFLLVLAITMVLQIQKQFSWGGVILLIFSLFGIMSLRFYIFYMVAIAVAGGFIVGLKTSLKAIAQRSAVLLLIALGLIYLGVIHTVSLDLETYGSLESVQRSRSDLVQSAESGFGDHQDVSTVGGALAVLPIGFLNLMFAPFPWEVRNFRQSLTLPEILVWWALIPFLIYGLVFTLKHHLRASFPVLIFITILTVAYSVFQGNVGTAYRQRIQIQVFLFIFIGVAWGLIRERLEDRKLVEMNRRRGIR